MSNLIKRGKVIKSSQQVTYLYFNTQTKKVIESNTKPKNTNNVFEPIVVNGKQIIFTDKKDAIEYINSHFNEKYIPDKYKSRLPSDLFK